MLNLRRLSFVLDGALQLNHLSTNFFHAGIETQGTAKRIEGRHEIVLKQETLPHARGRGEVVGIDLQGLVRIANRGVVLSEVIVGSPTLTPSLGDPRGLVDQLGGEVDGSLVVFSLIEAN